VAFLQCQLQAHSTSNYFAYFWGEWYLPRKIFKRNTRRREATKDRKPFMILAPSSIIRKTTSKSLRCADYVACMVKRHIYTGCPRRNVPNFGRVFLRLKYTDITQNTCIQSWTVTEIMAREKCGLLELPRTVPAQLMQSAGQVQ